MLPPGRTPAGHVAFAPVHVAPFDWRARSRPIAEGLHRFVLAEDQRHLAGSDVGKALNYTLLANCRSKGIDPEGYLIEILKRMFHEAI